jgi:hypothetical protein
MKLSRFTPWFSRLVLLAATLVLLMIGQKFILDPVGAAAASNMTLGSTDIRFSIMPRWYYHHIDSLVQVI